MSQNRLSNDSCAYTKELAENKNIFYYTVDVNKYEACSQCTENSVNRQRMPTRVDIESNLRIQPHKASLCPEKQFQPCVAGGTGPFCNIQPSNVPVLCERGMVNMYQNFPRNIDVSYEDKIFPLCKK